MMHAARPPQRAPEIDGSLLSTTPAGLQSVTTLLWRRRAFVVLNLTSFALLLGLVASVLGSGGWSGVDVALFACCALILPWTILGCWNALIGLWLIGRGPAGLAAAAPFAGAAHEPIRIDTAIVMPLRNEDPRRALVRLERVKASVDATGWGERFAYHVLSDSDDPAVAAAEERAVAAWSARDPEGGPRIAYRRRATNAGFKAGNLQDFCRQQGGRYTLMLPLDADSAMEGAQILNLVRIMQAHPKIGILQSLVVGTPSDSPFARIFQFGMRQGMRPYTVGAAWWAGDCGPFWGHNALVRIAPFAVACQLPVLPEGLFGGPILSHDQVEAVLMRRAGYEVRVLPVEGGSFEDNPPTLLEHVAREARWCLGNLQYVRLLGLRGIAPTGRFQLTAAVMMFLTAPALTLALALFPLAVMQAEPSFPVALAAVLYLAWLVGSMAPKLAGYAEILASETSARRYGGRARFAAGAVVELVFALHLFSVLCVCLTASMVRSLTDRRSLWSRQDRDGARVTIAQAFRRLWLCFGYGLGLALWTIWLSPTAFLWSLPLLSGPLLCIPFAVATSLPRLGRTMRRMGLCASPEELARQSVVAGAAADHRADGADRGHTVCRQPG
jgi:membrane glycosyltransferase